jgi:hypothetical protein
MENRLKIFSFSDLLVRDKQVILLLFLCKLNENWINEKTIKCVDISFGISCCENFFQSLKLKFYSKF